MLDPPRCQVCKESPFGMVRWPTENDDYICIDCLRERFEKLNETIEEADKLLTRGQEIVDRQMAAVKALESENTELKERIKFLEDQNKDLNNAIQKNKRKAGWS